MKVLVAEDGPLVGDAFSEALRARYHTVFRAATEDTVNRLSDGEIDVGILDVQLNDGTAWDVLEYVRIYVRRLRAKLDRLGLPDAIESRPGLGYRLREP